MRHKIHKIEFKAVHCLNLCTVFLHNFGTSSKFEEKSSDHFKDLYKVKLLTDFDSYLTSVVEGAMNNVFNIETNFICCTSRKVNFDQN